MKKTNLIRRFFILGLVIVTFVAYIPITALAEDTVSEPLTEEVVQPEPSVPAEAGEEIEAMPSITLMGASAATSVSTAEELNTVFQNGGEAVLDSNITLSSPLTVASGKAVTLDLNGKTIDRGLMEETARSNGNVITIEGTLTLDDSQGTGKITGGKKSGYTGGGGIYVKGGAFTMNGGSINDNTSADGGGGGVFVESGSFTMNGGDISGNTSAGNGGGVRVNDGSTLIISAGEISGNTAKQYGGVFVDGGSFTMNTGSISGNTAAGTEVGTGNGGGVAVLYGGSFVMKGGEISSNTATGFNTMAGNGGGVYVNMSGSFTMDGGTIRRNEAKEGGGVYLDGSVYLGGSVSSVNMNDGEISENTTGSISETISGYGGGVYVASGVFNTSGGRISKNEAEQGGGIYMLNGVFTMTDCEISENVTFEALMSQGGGVNIAGGAFTMNSGKINNNKSANGGGVYGFGGTFTMKGGQINENTAYVLPGKMCNGGGVYLNPNGTFNMEGGEIRGNATSAWNMYNHGGGVFVYGGTFKISGGVTITDNSRSGVPNNLFLNKEANTIEVAGALTGEDGTIGISTGIAPTGTALLVVARGSGSYAISDTDRIKFVSDIGGTLSRDANTVVLAEPPDSYLKYLSYNSNGGSGLQGSTAILEGMDNHLTVASGAAFSRTNCSFAGWNTKPDGSGNDYQAGQELILTENTTLYAQWTIDRAELTLAAPQGGADPSNSVTCVPSGITSSIAWKHGGDNLTGRFDYNTEYSAEITLNAGSGCKFAGNSEAQINGQTAVIQSRSDTVLLVSCTFAKTGSHSTPTAAVNPAVIDIANTGGSGSLTLNAAGISEGDNPITWTMTKTDNSNILTLPATTSGVLTNGALDLGSFAVTANSDGQPQKSASVVITFGGNADGDYAGIPASITVTFRLAPGKAPDAKLDYTNERVIGVSAGMEYLVNDSDVAPGDWTGAAPVTGTEIPLSGIIPDADKSPQYIHIRLAGIDGSVSKTIEIPARPNLRDILDWDSWVLHNIENDVESGYVPEDFGYRINNDSPGTGDNSESWIQIKLNAGDTLTFWQPATESIELPDGSFTNGSFKSAEITVTAPARLEKPNVSVDYENKTLNTEPTMQYKLSAGGVWTSCTADMSASNFGWDGTEAVSVQFRYPCTDKNYASDAQVLTIPALAEGTGSVTMSSWTYGDTAAEPVPVSATNGTNSVTYTYVGTKGDGSAYSSSTKPSDVGSYTVTATFAARSGYKPVTSEAASFTITKKAIDVQWTNLHNVYDGTEKTATLTLPSLEVGDAGSVSVTITGGQRINAGFQRVTASLSGSRAFNYNLTNPFGTLTIQRAPVTFTVGDNTILYDGEPKTATVTAMANGKAFGDFTVSYKQGSTVIPTPAAVGIYDIYASFDNANYRHVDGADGSERKIGVLSIFSQAPVMYKTSFVPGEGSGTMDDLTDAAAGTVRILPRCTFAGADGSYVFAGWMLEGKLYSAGAAFVQPARNVSLTAQWVRVHRVSGVVTRNGSPAAGAVVTLMLGSQRVDETVTDADGKYQFNNVPPGIYNLTGTKDGTTITIKKEVMSADITGADITLPLGKTNSVVEVLAGTPDIVVGNLEKIFEHQDKIVFTDADQDAVHSGGTVEIRIVAEVVAEDSEASDQKKIVGYAQGTPGLYLEMSLKKSVSSGGSTVETPLTVSNVLLEVVIPLPAELQGKDNYVVYRCHEGTVQTLTTTPNADGEYIVVNQNKTSITIYTKKFSTYAIGLRSIDVSVSGNNHSRSGKAAPAATMSEKTAGIPYYLDAKGNKIFLGFSFDSNGTMKYVAPKGETILFAENSKNFTDIANHWAKSSIEFITQREVFQGTGSEKFSPNTGMTRGMFAAVIGRLYEESYGMINSSGSIAFTDVTSDSYYVSYIDWAEKNGIMEGSGEGKFAPERLITREEMASILYRFARFLKLSGTEITGIQLGYSDISQINSWALDAAKYCQEANLITGRENGKFAPGGTATRAEVATILQRFIKSAVS